jgi:hypothetical protein
MVESIGRTAQYVNHEYYTMNIIPQRKLWVQPRYAEVWATDPTTLRFGVAGTNFTSFVFSLAHN